jgi:hypothetical protein
MVLQLLLPIPIPDLYPHRQDRDPGTGAQRVVEAVDVLVQTENAEMAIVRTTSVQTAAVAWTPMDAGTL